MSAGRYKHYVRLFLKRKILVCLLSCTAVLIASCTSDGKPVKKEKKAEELATVSVRGVKNAKVRENIEGFLSSLPM